MALSSRRNLIGAALLASLLAACGGGDEESSNFSSGGTSAQAAPSSFIGRKLVQTVQTNDGNSTTIAVGRTITYNFVDSTTVMGEGLATKLTDDWAYSVSGSTAQVRLTYPNGESIDTLTFTSATGGTYVSNITFFASGQKNQHRGTFTVSAI